MEELLKVAEQFEALAWELEQARAHALTAAEHFRSAAVPRGTAHAFACQGHLKLAQNNLDTLAINHAQHAKP